MTPRFLALISLLLREEKGYVNDPRDSGLETNWGISRKSYPHLPIALLTRDDAIAIYWRDYWTPIRGDALPGGLDLLMLECAVNQGVETAVTLLQEEINEYRAAKDDIDVDGDLGPQTLAAIRAMSHDDLVDRYAARRAWRYEINAQEGTYGKGWFRRLMRAHREAVTA